ncbi:MAG TPA: hypothetical protein VHU17_09080, partial [Acidimicrobiales bacterium]|nr:hypothetical protein [Acidimicrobiales bacterium]
MHAIEPLQDVPASPAVHDAATDLAQRAGAVLLDLESQSQHSGRSLSDEGDRRSHHFLMAELASRFPHDP